MSGGNYKKTKKNLIDYQNGQHKNFFVLPVRDSTSLFKEWRDDVVQTDRICVSTERNFPAARHVA